jgi:hypothetical protein
MNIPTIKGIIDRRMLVNYHVDPSVLSQVLPAPFRPQIVNGFGIAGICLIRLKSLRPPWLPALPGWSSENAAHRIAVEWDQDGQVRHGVYVPRRDTNSRLAVCVGGRLFPGVHHHARFEVHEAGDRIAISLESDDGQVHLSVAGRRVNALPAESIFASMQQASEFFEAGAMGYSATGQEGRFDGLELRCHGWKVEPIEIESLASSFFDDRNRFPAESARLDCALLMRGVRHEWHGERQLCCAGNAVEK